MSDLSGGRPVSVGGPLVVPVHLDALCPADDLDVRGPDNDRSMGAQERAQRRRDRRPGAGTADPGAGRSTAHRDLTRSIAAALGAESLGSGDFARQMIETAERVTFLSS